MRARNTFKLLVLILATGSIWLAGCKKTSPAAEAPSIVGTWAVDSESEILKTSTAVIFDTTIVASGTGQFALTFNADGFYTEFTNTGITGSAYTFYGTALSLYDTSGGTNRWIRYTVPVLTENRLEILSGDTSVTGDTTAQVTFRFSR